MKTTLHLLLGWLIMSCSVSAAQDVEQALHQVATALHESDLPSAKVKELAFKMTSQQLAEQLIAKLWAAEDHGTEAASIRMLLAINPFPFVRIKELVTSEVNSTKRAYLLFLLNKGASAPGQVNEVLEVAKSMLGDTGKGIRRYGEARAYSADGLRVCDVAYNVLVTRLQLNPAMTPVDVDNYVPDKRNALILQLAERASIRLSTDDSKPAGSKSAAPEGSLNVPKPPPTPKETPRSQPTSIPNEEPASSTPWSIIVVVIVAAMGVLWLLVKNRK